VKKFGKSRRKSKLNSEKIGKTWKKGKLNSEKIWKNDITVILLNVELNTINLTLYLQRHIPTYLSIYIFIRIIDFIHFFARNNWRDHVRERERMQLKGPSVFLVGAAHTLLYKAGDEYSMHCYGF
jgi:hypothetical protein